jgi:Amt family ammonium transporter
MLGGIGGVSLMSQLIGTASGIVIALAGGAIVYAVLKATIGIRMSREDEFDGADLTIHRIAATTDS